MTSAHQMSPGFPVGRLRRFTPLIHPPRPLGGPTAFAPRKPYMVFAPSIQNVESPPLPLRTLSVRQEQLQTTPPRSAGFPARSKPRTSSAPILSNFQFFTCNLKLFSPLTVSVRFVGDLFSSLLCVLRVSVVNLPSPQKNVEKLSFGPHRLACTSKAKKIFSPRFSTFPPPKTVQLSCLLRGLCALSVRPSLVNSPLPP